MNQWQGGQKANAIKEQNEADSKPAESASMHRESHLELGAFYLSSGQQTRSCKHNKGTSITSGTTSITFCPQLIFIMHFRPNAMSWLFLLKRAPETETDEFHFDFSAILFERNNGCSRKKKDGGRICAGRVPCCAVL